MIKYTFYVEDFPDLLEDTPMTIVIPRNAGRRFPVEIELPLDGLSRPMSPRTALAFSPSPVSYSSPSRSPLSLAEVGQSYSPSPISAMQSISQSSMSLSPGEDRFTPRQLTPQSSRTAVGVDGRIDSSRLTSPLSPLYPSYSLPASPSPSFFSSPSSPSRQPTLLEAMQQSSPGANLLSPGFSPLSRVSPGYFGDSSMNATNPANFSPYGLSAGASSEDLSPRSLSRLMTSPRIMSPQALSFMGNTVVEVTDFNLSPTAVQPAPAYGSNQASPCLSPYVGGQTNRPSLEQMDAMGQYGPYY